MAPRRTRGPRPRPTWGGRRREGAPGCSSGGSPSPAAAVAGDTAAAVAPSSWQLHREPSFQFPAGHDSSAVVAKVAVDHSSASSSSGYFSPRDEVSTSSLQPPSMSSPAGCSPKQPGLATDADGADAVVSASSGNPSAAIPSSLQEEEELLSPALQMEVAVPEEEHPLWPELREEVALQMAVAKFMVFYFDAYEKRMLSKDDIKSISPALKLEVAIEFLFRLDLARKKRILSADELDLYDDMKSQLPSLEAEIEEVNAHGEDAVVVEEEEEEVPVSPSRIMEAALKIMFRLDLAREMRKLTVNELDLYDNMKSLLPHLEADIGEDNADGADVVEEEDNADGAHAVEEEEEEPLWPALQKEVALQMLVARFMVIYFDAHEKRVFSTDELKSLSPALKLEVAIEVLFQFDMARKKRTLSADELDLIIHLKSQLPCLEAEIGEVNAHGEDVVDEEEVAEEEPISPSRIMEAALKIMFRLDLAREMRILSVDELDLSDNMKSLLPRLEAEIGEDYADGADVVEEEDNADGAGAVEEEEVEEPLSPAVRKELAIEILFQFELARKKRILSDWELDLIIFLKSLSPRLEAEIEEINEDKEEEKEVEALLPALEMEAALKVMFRLDLAREMRTLSADELDLYDEMKSLLPRLEAEIREVATAPSIALEDPPTYQLHAPSGALAGANEVPSPMVPGSSTSIKLSADLQLPERSIVVTNTELSTPGPEATPSVLKSSAEPESAVKDDPVEEEEEEVSPVLQMEVAIDILFRFKLARKKRVLSADELDLISRLKSLLPRLEAEIEEIKEEEEEEEEEALSPSLEMEAALKVMFRLDLAREMRTLSADELDLYDEMKSLLPRLAVEIREVATAPSIAMEDPPTCQLHAPSVALAGVNDVWSPMVPGASTSIKLSADLQLPEHSIAVTNAELSTPGPEATPSVLKSSAEPEPAVEDDEITEALYQHSVRRRRLPIFRYICPE